MEQTAKPPILVSPIRGEVESPLGKRVVGPFVELDRQALVYIDHLIQTDPRAAQDFIEEMLVVLEEG